MTRGDREVRLLVQRFRDRDVLPRASRAEQDVVDRAVVSWELFGRVTSGDAERLGRIARRLWPRTVVANRAVEPRRSAPRRRRPEPHPVEVYIVDAGS